MDTRERLVCEIMQTDPFSLKETDRMDSEAVLRLGWLRTSRFSMAQRWLGSSRAGICWQPRSPENASVSLESAHVRSPSRR